MNRPVYTRATLEEAGQGKYYHIHVRPSVHFLTFAIEYLGAKGNLMRIVGKHASGMWYTVTWLVQKNIAHVSRNGRLVIDDARVRAILSQLISPIFHKSGDDYMAKPRYTAKEQYTWHLSQNFSLAT